MLNSFLGIKYYLCGRVSQRLKLPKKIIVKIYLIENKEVTLFVKVNR